MVVPYHVFPWLHRDRNWELAAKKKTLVQKILRKFDCGIKSASTIYPSQYYFHWNDSVDIPSFPYKYAFFVWNACFENLVCIWIFTESGYFFITNVIFWEFLRKFWRSNFESEINFNLFIKLIMKRHYNFQYQINNYIHLYRI